MIRRLSFLLLLVPLTSEARVISYAPYSDRISVPAIQHRLTRHFALFEQTTSNLNLPTVPGGEVVLYDSKGEEEPRVVFPQDGSTVVVDGVALREAPEQTPQILIAAYSLSRWLLSGDGGTTWRSVAMKGRLVNSGFPVDVGGMYVRSRYGNVRIGPPESPFVAVTVDTDGSRLYAIRSDGTAQELATSPVQDAMRLCGSDLEGRRFLLRTGNQLSMVTLDGAKTPLGTISASYVEGWITPSGGAYIEQYNSSADTTLWYASNGSMTFIDGTYDKTKPGAIAPPIFWQDTQVPFFSVPTITFEGAWIVKRVAGAPTQLLLHTPARGSQLQWSDITAPEVEAIHPSLSGDKLLIQVHRPRRAVDQLVLRDPALAVWRIGDPAPRSYDELYLAESNDKGFVHLDVDTIESGSPFVFDSGRTTSFGFPPVNGPSAGGGGSDVVQEWGVVRGSLVQKLVLPGFGRTPGAFGSLWRTDLTLYNPNAEKTDVTLRFVPNGEVVTASELREVTLTLAAHEIRAVPDALKALFHAESGLGALFITPEARKAISATGRTYTQSGSGTYGYGMNAIDVFAAASARFPLTFSGAFQGPNFRTNLATTDVSGRGTEARFAVNGPYGEVPINSASTIAAPFSATQLNGLTGVLGLRPSDFGALVYQPTRGEAVASLFTIDNRTNDPTFFPPDIPASTARTIPAIGHLDGANGSQFRSDLFLYNHSSLAKTLSMEMRSWSGTDTSFLSLTLLPHEARVIPDVLKTAFGRTGIARLRVSSQTAASDPSLRVTSRTYTVDANGGTYGFLMPPLNSFQNAGPGDTLEILGASLENRFRTNIGLVDTASFSSRQARAQISVIDAGGAIIDSFEIAIPLLGGTQINDVFRARTLPADGGPVLIRVSVIEGTVGAYVAAVDNETNDPTYFAANLAAKP